MEDSAPNSAASLATRNSAGHTRIHTAARYGELRGLPEEALSAQYLTLRNDAGSVSYTHLDVYKRQTRATPPFTMPPSGDTSTRYRRR